ncbi:MAG: Calx-beta domain-containing protein, partial [Cyanobacteria bacterium J06629_19]
HKVGVMFSQVVDVTDGTLNIEFLHDTQNPLINGIEIIQLSDQPPVLPTVSVTNTTLSATENSSSLQIAVSTGTPIPANESIEVFFEIVPGTATAGLDYELVGGTLDANTGIYSGTITIAGNTSEASVSVDILTDTLSELDETFSFNITEVSPNAQIGESGTLVTLIDDDNPAIPVVSLIDIDTLVSESAGQLQISLAADIPVPIDQTVNISFEIVPGTATAGVDYTYPDGTLNPETGVYTGIVTLNSGDIEANFNINIEPDTLDEPNEAFTINLTGISPNAEIGNGITSVTIADDDSASVPIVSIISGDTTVSEDSGQVQVSLATDFTVPADETVTVSFEISPGTATPLEDYEFLGGTYDETTGVYAGTVSIAGSSSDATFSININQDTFVEASEAFTVDITGVSANAQIGTSTATFTIEDDDISGTSGTVIYRVNAGGSEIVAVDGGPNWSADTQSNNSAFLSVPGSNTTTGFSDVQPGPTVAPGTSASIFATERWDSALAPEMQWAFDTPVAGQYEVRLFMGNGFGGTDGTGDRIFDVSIEGNVPAQLDDIDLSGQFGHKVGVMFSQVVDVTDGTLNIEFLHDTQNPLINGIEIIQLGDGTGGDTLAPIAGLVQVLTDIVGVTADPQLIQAQFSDDTALDETTIDGDELQVTDTNGNPLAVSLNNVSGTTATYAVAAPSGTWDADDDGTYTVEVVGASVSDTAGNPIATTSLGSFEVATDTTPAVGAATFSINLNSNNVQTSNFADNSFVIENVGDKKITKVELDVTETLYPDSVFDPFGVAGDTVSKPLTINTNGGTGVVTPSNASYIGTGGTAGFEGIELIFDEAVDGGFEPGDSLGFSVDMDPNSIAGAQVATLDSGTTPVWHVGAVSGAELIGSTVTVTFADGTTATSQLQGNNNQAGSQTLASQVLPDIPVTLSVNNLNAGGTGTYDSTGPSVVVNGLSGQTARIVLTKGFIQPTTNNFAEPYKSQLDDQLAALATTPFPANNAAEFQTVDILLSGSDQDISAQFDFSGVDNFNFPGEDQLALGFVASVIDPNNSNLPIGPVSQPIYLQFAAAASSIFALDTAASFAL